MDTALHNRIQGAVLPLVRGPHRVIVHRTGSTGGLDQWLWVPGASRYLDDVAFTYRQEATSELVGREIHPPFVSEDVAIQMAAGAYERAFKFASQGGDAYRPIIAVGVTSAVATNRKRAGDDRAFICVRTGAGFYLVDVQMDKAADSQDARDLRREEQATMIDFIVLNVILWAAGEPQIPFSVDGFESLQFTLVGEGQVVVRPQRIDKDPADIFDQVFWASRDAMHPSGAATPIDRVDWKSHCLLPGSFNPLHFGHLAIAQWMERETGRRVVFQISQHHPIKRDLAFDEGELRRRLLQFRFRHPIVVTRFEGLYFDKARRFPGAHILMGADALINMLNPQYYIGGEEGLRRELQECLDRETIFWVVDRECDGVTRSLTNIPIPSGYESLFRHLAAVNVISSSEIRAQHQR